MKKNFFCAIVSVFLTVISVGLKNEVSAEEVSVQVEPLEGDTFVAHLTGTEKDALILEPSAPDVTSKGRIPIKNLKRISFISGTPTDFSLSDESATPNGTDAPTVSNVPETLKVEIDESIFRASSVMFQEGKFQLTLPLGGEVEPLLPGQIQQILFQESELGKDADLDADWAEIQSLETPNDLLVILRNGKLSYYYGTVLEMTEKTVRFEQEGDSLNVRLKHVFALRFAESERSSEVPPSASSLLGVLTDAAGSQIFVSELNLDAISVPQTVAPQETASSVIPGVQIILTSGLKAELPFAALRTLDFTEGRTVFLSSLKPESVAWKPFFAASEEVALPMPALDSLEKFSRPQMDRNFSGGSIRLGGIEYLHGIEMVSRTQLVFRLPGTFQKFQTIVGLDDAVRPAGCVEVTIFADDQVLYHAILTGKDEPIPLSLDLAGARRLTLLVDFGEATSLSDLLVFADAKLLK